MMPDYESLQLTVTTLVALAAIVITFWNMRKVYLEARQPQVERDKRLDAVEEHLDNDNRRLKDLEEMTKLTLQAQLAMLDALVEDNPKNHEELKSVRDKIVGYLLKR